MSGISRIPPNSRFKPLSKEQRRELRKMEPHIATYEREQDMRIFLGLDVEPEPVPEAVPAPAPQRRVRGRRGPYRRKVAA